MKKDNAAAKAIVRWLITGVVVIGVVALGRLAWQEGVVPLWITNLFVGAGDMQRGAAINDIQGVGCFTGEEGEYLTYTDAKGTENIVESPAQVPGRFRDSARCIHLQKKR